MCAMEGVGKQEGLKTCILPTVLIWKLYGMDKDIIVVILAWKLQTKMKAQQINIGVRLTLLILMHGLENGEVECLSGLLTIKINDTGGGRDFIHL
jgi:hypothetical protein